MYRAPSGFRVILQVSLLPRCSSVGAMLSAATLGEALQLFGAAALDCLVAIFTESYISLVAVLLIFALFLSFAAAGGVGAPPHRGARP